MSVQAVTATDNNSQAASSPVTLQAHWMSSRTAEVYLGELTGATGTAASLAYDLPVGAVTLPDGASVRVEYNRGFCSGCRSVCSLGV